VTTIETTAPRPVGRPRSSHASEAIIAATIELLLEGVTIEALSMEAIAARAGVGKATVYRRWPNKEALVVEALASVKGPTPEPPGHSVREDLVFLLGVMGRSKQVPEATVSPCVMSEVHRNPELFDRWVGVLEKRRDVMREVLRRGVRTGELDPDLDIELAVAMLSSPMMMQMALRWYPRVGKEKLAERIVDLALSGMAGSR
jgi:AcrR family transcriptional regulator